MHITDALHRQAVVWRCLHSFFLGYVLQQQSKKRAWTRHYEEVGRTPQEAFHSFKALYNISLTMNYVVFVAFAIKIYELPQLWSQLLAQGFGLVRMIVYLPHSPLAGDCYQHLEFLFVISGAGSRRLVWIVLP